ncbi:acyltransferase family protein [Arthrobacter sp. Soc17.1.1.1]|uniref:acyltransferase family protein n=1 Tax=Arthrobacter sp. Soc17.1.1.1 TaxID=3121277 RepID=UPI002FE4CBD0
MLTGASKAAPNDHFAWADVIKGTCIVLVVLVHVTNKYFVFLPGPEPFRVAWEVFGRGLNPLRMPLFFLISGFLAARSIGRPWGRTLLPRVVQPYYLYVIWLVVSAAIYIALATPIDGTNAASARGVAEAFLYPASSLWYLYALAAYFLIAKGLCGLPRPVSLAIAVCLAVVVSAWPLTVQLGVPANLVFFMAGAYFPHVVQAVAERATPTRALLGSGLYLGVVLIYVVDADRFPGVRPAASAVAIWAGLTVLSVLARFSPFERLGQYIGRHTLPVYVLHLPLLALLSRLYTPAFDGGLVSTIAAAVYPAITVVALVAAALGLCILLRGAGLGWLFSMPKRLVRA